MGRRRNGSGFIEITQGIAALCALAFLHPGIRHHLLGFAGTAIWLAVFALLFTLLLVAGLVLRPKFNRDLSTEKTSSTGKSLTDQLHTIDWFQFEKLIEVAYAKTHKVVRYGGANPDGGIDLIIEKAEGPNCCPIGSQRYSKVLPQMRKRDGFADGSDRMEQREAVLGLFGLPTVSVYFEGPGF